MILQFCGLSGSGKTTLAYEAKSLLRPAGIDIEVIDGDEYRSVLCADLGFTQQDRATNIRRLAFVANRMAAFSILPVICAINPYEAIRQEVAQTYAPVKTIFIKCSLEELARRDRKGLYARAMLPDSNPNKLRNLSGVNDIFENPIAPDLVLETDRYNIAVCSALLVKFIRANG